MKGLERRRVGLSRKLRGDRIATRHVCEDGKEDRSREQLELPDGQRLGRGEPSPVIRRVDGVVVRGQGVRGATRVEMIHESGPPEVVADYTEADEEDAAPSPTDDEGNPGDPFDEFRNSEDAGESCACRQGRRDASLDWTLLALPG